MTNPRFPRARPPSSVAVPTKLVIIPAGATIRVQPGSRAALLNVSMTVLEGTIQGGGIAGIRVDLPIKAPGQPTAYPQSASYFFYQADFSVSPHLAADHIRTLYMATMTGKQGVN